MTDEDQNEEILEEAAEEAFEEVEAAIEHEIDDDFPEGISGEHAEALDTARAEKLARQAFFHGVDKQLLTFLFANCFFVAGALAAWSRAAPGDAVDQNAYITGLDTIRGAFIFGLGLYGFWVAFFNIFYGQMRVGPFFLNALIALWVGVGGFSRGIGGEAWEQAGEYLKTLEKKVVLDDILVRLSVVAPGYWLLTIGGLMVLFVVLTGLMKGRSSTKEAPPASARRRRR